MKKRNPLFVAGFPYGLIVAAYIGLLPLDFSDSKPTDSELTLIFLLLGIFFIGAGYSLYWQIVTARHLRKATGTKIPLSILIVIPLVSYWWTWRYSVAAEAYTRGKVPTALAFVLLILLGPIGMGILQDYYNKIPVSRKSKTA